ncbi:MAG TPA: MFS transporter [Burkholderiales bacterium]|jgi:MFS family permease
MNSTASAAAAADKHGWRTPLVVLLAGALVVNMTMGVRHGMGLFLNPVTQDLGLSRETFSFAIALQNLCWGLFTPILGGIADRYGAAKVMVVSLIVYALGLWGMSAAHSSTALILTAGVAMGLAQGGSTFGIITGIVGRAYPPEQRAQGLAVSGALGALGQFYMMPLLQSLISGASWQLALLVSALLMVIIIPLSLAMTEPYVDRSTLKKGGLAAALDEAVRDPSFVLLSMGYFVCGFQVVFIAVHLPVYLRDIGMNANVGARALAVIAVGNIVGTYLWGMQGGRYPKRLLLSSIYLLRAVVILAFLFAPKSEAVVYVFAGAIGALWLSTVPLTNGLVAARFGVAYLSMLSGIVFLGHQLGSFTGVWMGGYLFDKTGSYFWAWIAAAVLGVFAALIHLPINEKPIRGLVPA